MQRSTTFAICFLLAGSFTVGLAASTSIGMVNARGGFQIDNAQVSGNATLFDGTVVQTGRVAGDLVLNTGAHMQLASDSRGRVFRDRLVLEQGAGQLQGTGYGIEARTLRIAADEQNAAARVALSGTTRVQVAALHGRLHVTNGRGVLVAKLEAGTALEFEPQSDGSSTIFRLTGVVRKEGGKFFLTDDTTKVTVELRGPGLAKMVGQQVEVNGSVDIDATPAASAAQVINVKSVTLAATAAAAAGAGAGAAGAAGAAGTAAGISATTVAIVGGVAVAGTVTGLGVTGSLPGQGDDSPPNSSR